MSKRGKAPDEAQGTPSPASQLVEYFAAQLAASRVSGAVDAAQEIMFEAWETEDPRKRAAMARKALKVSPDCADAYVLLAEETAKTAEQAVELYSQGVGAGARALGDAAFVEDVGAFWGLLETRPYMRARLGLALALWEAARAEEAIAHGQEMLRLNPHDNQGVRYFVLNWLQRLGRDTEADSLLRQYKDDPGTEWAWSAALAAFRRHGDSATARKALAQAGEANPHVAPYLLGRKKLPRRPPDFVAMGGKDEAAAYVHATAATWKATPGALEWLASTIDPTAAARPAAKSGP
jgi:tetratricopeptide (TPR) repeat protein